MRTTLALLLLLAPAASAQTAGGARPTPPGLAVAEAAWVPSYPVFFMTGEGPSGPAIHPTPLPGNRLRYPSRRTGAGFRGVRRGSDIWRNARVRLTNTGAVAVRSVKFDFVFNDPATGEELLRLGHSSRKRLRPGKTLVYDKTVNSSGRTRRGDGARLSVEFREVAYADGSVWRP